jgi:hypothetical protein
MNRPMFMWSGKNPRPSFGLIRYVWREAVALGELSFGEWRL